MDMDMGHGAWGMGHGVCGRGRGRGRGKVWGRGAGEEGAVLMLLWRTTLRQLLMMPPHSVRAWITYTT